MRGLAFTILVVITATQTLGRRFDSDDDFDTRASRSYTTQLQQFLDVDLRDLMKNGNSTLGIPVLDPLELPEVELDIDEKIAMIQGKITDLYSEDVSTYKVRVAKVSMIGMKATIGLTFPRIYAKGKYAIKGVVMQDVDIYGDGEFEITVEDFDVDAVIAVKVVGGIKIKSIDLKIALGGFAFKATGIFNDENTSLLLSEVISDMAPSIISDYHDQITGTASALLVEIANKFLEKNDSSSMKKTQL